MDGRPTWTDCDEAGDYVVPNVLSPRDLVFRPVNMDETVPHIDKRIVIEGTFREILITLSKMKISLCTIDMAGVRQHLK